MRALPKGGPIILARSLLRYDFIAFPTGLSRSAADRAVLLAAESRTPFRDAGTIVLRLEDGYAIWFWDRERLEQLVPGAATADGRRFVPETSVVDPVEGWRLLEVSGGFEAQYWRKWTLRASQWRRRSFTEDQWASFVDGVIESFPEVGERPPLPIAAKAVRNGPPPRGNRVSPPKDVWTAFRGPMILGLCAGAAAIAFFGAEALRFELSSASQRADLQKLEDEIAAATGNAKWEQEEATLAQLADEASRSNPLAIAAIALDHVRTLDLVSKGFSVSTDRLRLEVEVPSGSELSELARRLEDEPLLVRVRPQLDSAKQHAVLFADICYLQPESRCHPVAIASNKASSTKLESYAGQSDAPPLTARAVP